MALALFCYGKANQTYLGFGGHLFDDASHYVRLRYRYGDVVASFAETGADLNLLALIDDILALFLFAHLSILTTTSQNFRRSKIKNASKQAKPMVFGPFLTFLTKNKNLKFSKF